MDPLEFLRDQSMPTAVRHSDPRKRQPIPNAVWIGGAGLAVLIILGAIGAVVRPRSDTSKSGTERKTVRNETARQAAESLAQYLGQSSSSTLVESVSVDGGYAIVKTSIFPDGDAEAAAKPIAGYTVAWIVGEGYDKFGVGNFCVQASTGAHIPVTKPPILELLREKKRRKHDSRL